MQDPQGYIPGTIPPETRARVLQALPTILKTVGSPVFVYDQIEMEERIKALFHFMRHVYGYQQYFAVKALPNPKILKIQGRGGSGLDCSDPYELKLKERAGVDRAILTSNNSRPEWFDLANETGSIINLDDISLIPKVRDFPETICFRLNPGDRQPASGLVTFGKLSGQKYGITWDQVAPAYKQAVERGARTLGCMMMPTSNCRDEDYIIGGLDLGFEACERIEEATGIPVSYYDMGGGFGVAYAPTDVDLNMARLGERIAERQDMFRKKHGYAPRIFTELGRWMTAPYGVLVLTAINRKDTYMVHVGVDAGMEALARPAFYDAYHHIEVVGGEGREMEIVNIVGSICEGWDMLAKQRLLAKILMGDNLLVANCGAHAHAMGSNYNGKCRLPEVLISSVGTVELIRRRETHTDLDATLNIDQAVASYVA